MYILYNVSLVIIFDSAKILLACACVASELLYECAGEGRRDGIRVIEGERVAFNYSVSRCVKISGTYVMRIWLAAKLQRSMLRANEKAFWSRLIDKIYISH